MAPIGSEHALRSRLFWPLSWAVSWPVSRRVSWPVCWRSPLGSLRALFTGGGDSSVARRLAGTAFLIRVVSALVAFLSQIALARWLGGYQFGIYVYVWTWILLLGLAYALGAPMTAISATLIAVVTLWAVTLAQLVVLDRRLPTMVEAGPKSYAVGSWLATAAPIFVVEAFYLLLTYADVIVLQAFRPSNEVGIYYVAAKTMALVAFIYFSVAQTLAHKFAEYHVGGDRKRLADFLAVAVRMTFWPSLGSVAVLLVFGRPLLRMFGADFVSGYYLMFIIAIGLLARASVGPAERLLNMLGERRSCALIYAGSFALDLVLCLLLIPPMGITGAAVAGAITLVCESASLYYIAKTRLGMHCFIFGGRKGR